ncbi:unnamed protein product [Moneuplotes crassus]|uniref:Uncharacterized protein n=1 Tax=Euplotes crassus TaxID=5936 RepID=A0AAD1XPW7_EUPCR|nr:unnamed protein product [Moneuplotes crassus]
MEDDYGSQNQNLTGNDTNIFPKTSERSAMPSTRSHSTKNITNAMFEESEELEDTVVAQTMQELDADILQAMENLSITDDDIKHSTSNDQSNQNPTNTTGEAKNPSNQDQGSTEIDPLVIGDYIQIISNELLKELQNTQDLDTGLVTINKAMQYVKDEAERRIKAKFKKPVVKLYSDNLVLKKAVRILFNKLELYKANQKMIREYEEMKAMLYQKDQEIKRLKDKEMELNFRLNSQTCHLSFNMDE